MSKTKKVSGVDLSARCFAYIGDENDTATWLLPLFVPGDTSKTVNLIKNALHRFDEAKGIPDRERAAVRLLVYGAAMSHGLTVDRSRFAVENEAQTPAAEPTQPWPVAAEVTDADVTDPAIAEAVALADYRATELLRSLGLE